MEPVQRATVQWRLFWERAVREPLQLLEPLLQV